MIIVKIWGGLGNQMFQYAMAKALALKFNFELKLDISHYSKNISNETPRQFRLNIFHGITDEIASQKDINTCITTFKVPIFNSIYKIINRKFSIFNPNYIIEKDKSFRSIEYIGTKNLFLEGYWQSEEYFKEYREHILNSFNLERLFDNSELALKVKQIEMFNSISIHVRRGDYVSNIQANSYHGICSLAYYEDAIKAIVNSLQYESVRFYIFSDDISWCKENLKISYDHEYITTTEDYHDLFLMGQCKHNIIANSSFSWWAAWLNPYIEKKVIAPKNWFVTEDVDNIVPNEWIRI
ncbi:alpha-1,2-fucosyltransferase [Pedobacter jeongneungensis]|uniref:Alpha-1,2-fucosyltransferase n=1 Tax=Pedobacter jeongneungensis TaxID=947309 RepID=A0ABP8BEX8_9SPHI